MRRFFGFLPTKYQMIAIPTTFLVGLAIVTFAVLRIGLDRISRQRKELGEARKIEQVLTSKLSALQNVQNEAVSLANLSVIALPSKNPGLSVISQVRALGVSRALVLADLKVGSEIKESETLFKEDVNFEIAGDLAQIFDFLNSLSTVAPITTLQKAKFSQAETGARGSITIRAYWAPFPKKLPALTESIGDLTSGEREVISKVSALSPPAFSDIPASSAVSRGSPFE